MARRATLTGRVERERKRERDRTRDVREHKRRELWMKELAALRAAGLLPLESTDSHNPNSTEEGMSTEQTSAVENASEADPSQVPSSSEALPRQVPSSSEALPSEVPSSSTPQPDVAKSSSVDKYSHLLRNVRVNIKRFNVAKLRGRRIVDVGFLLKALQAANKHSQTDSCNLSDMAILRENRTGLLSCFELKCMVCGLEVPIWSDDPDDEKKNINGDAVKAMLNISGGYADIQTLLKHLAIPPLTQRIYATEYAKIAREWINSSTETPQQGSSAVPEADKQIPEEETRRTVERVELAGVVLEHEIEVDEGSNSVVDPEYILPRELEVVASEENGTSLESEVPLNKTLIKQEVLSDVEDDTMEITEESGTSVPNTELKAGKLLPDKQRPSCAIEKETSVPIVAVKQEEILPDKQRPSCSIEEETSFSNTVVKQEKILPDEQIPSCALKEKEHHHKENETRPLLNLKNLISSISDESTQDSSSKNNSFNTLAVSEASTGAIVAGGLFPGAVIPVGASALPQFGFPTQLISVGTGIVPAASTFPQQIGFIIPVGQTTTAGAAPLPHELSTVFPGQIISVGQTTAPGTSTLPQNLSGVFPASVSSVGAPVASETSNEGNRQSTESRQENVRTDMGYPRQNDLRMDGSPATQANNPFTLPGGAPKGVSSPVPPSSPTMGHSNQVPKRPRFNCDICDVVFTNSESLESHKLSYCIKRFRVPPSSTVTSHILPLPRINGETNLTSSKSYQPSVEDLEEAMVVKRTLLEASIKAALDAQSVIRDHKEVQQRTQKAFKDLDDALNRERALTPQASLGERMNVFTTRSQALLKAEAAYKEEKNSAIVVEDALFKQKLAIEGTVSASAREQTALISVLLQYRAEAEKRDVSLSQNTNVLNRTDFPRENNLVCEPSWKNVMPQQFADNWAVGSTSMPKQFPPVEISRTLETRNEMYPINRLRQFASHLANSEDITNLNSVASNVNQSQSVMQTLLSRNRPQSLENSLSQGSFVATSFLPDKKKYSVGTDQIRMPYCMSESDTVGSHSSTSTYANSRNLPSQIHHLIPDIYLQAQATDFSLPNKIPNSLSGTHLKGVAYSSPQSKRKIHSSSVVILNNNTRLSPSDQKMSLEYTQLSEIMDLSSDNVDSRLTSQLNYVLENVPRGYSNPEELMNLTTGASDETNFTEANESQTAKTNCSVPPDDEFKPSCVFSHTALSDRSCPSETTALTEAVSDINYNDKKRENSPLKSDCSISSSSDSDLEHSNCISPTSSTISQQKTPPVDDDYLLPDLVIDC